MPITSITRDLIGEVERLMRMGSPYVRVRSASDYWLYSTLFSSTCPVAVDARTVVGAVVAMRSQDDPDDIYVQDVMVHPAYRRRGIATALLDAVVEQAQRWDVRRLYLTSEPDNTAADATWRQLGFWNRLGERTIGGVHVVSDFKGPGMDRAVYEKVLPSARGRDNGTPAGSR
jgi:GNAT superfamily N-acetyltransferase